MGLRETARGTSNKVDQISLVGHLVDQKGLSSTRNSLFTTLQNKIPLGAMNVVSVTSTVGILPSDLHHLITKLWRCKHIIECVVVCNLHTTHCSISCFISSKR